MRQIAAIVSVGTVLALGLLSGGVANAGEFRALNCANHSGAIVSVSAYNENDTLKVIPKSTQQIRPGTSSMLRCGTELCQYSVTYPTSVKLSSTSNLATTAGGGGYTQTFKGRQAIESQAICFYFAYKDDGLIDTSRTASALYDDCTC